MEAERDPLGEADPCDFAASEVRRIQHAEFAAVGRRVIDNSKEPAVVLVRAVDLRNEDRFSPTAAMSVVVLLNGTGREIGLQSGSVKVRDLIQLDLGGLPVTVFLESESRIVPREFLRAVTDPSLRDPTRRRVDDPPVECRGRLGKGTLPIIDHEVVVPAKINNNRSVGRVVGVERVEHITGVNVAPDDVVGGAIPGQQTNARGAIVVPLERECVPSNKHVHVDGDGQVVDDDMTLADLIGTQVH